GVESGAWLPFTTPLLRRARWEKSMRCLPHLLAPCVTPPPSCCAATSSLPTARSFAPASTSTTSEARRCGTPSPAYWLNSSRELHDGRRRNRHGQPFSAGQPRRSSALERGGAAGPRCHLRNSLFRGWLDDVPAVVGGGGQANCQWFGPSDRRPGALCAHSG